MMELAMIAAVATTFAGGVAGSVRWRRRRRARRVEKARAVLRAEIRRIANERGLS